MSNPEAVGAIVQRIMAEMQATFARLHGARRPFDLIELPPPVAQLPQPRRRFLKGGKEDPCGSSSAD